MSHRVEILAYADAQVLDITGPLQVFVSANDLARAAGQPKPYEVDVVGKEPSITTSAGISLSASELPSSDAPLKTLLVPGGWGVNDACKDQVIVSWLSSRSAVAERVASVCSGAFLLATIGILDGLRVATHWQRCAELSQRFPAVRVDPEPIFIKENRIWTSAGVTAGIDLALALVDEDLGREAALAVARQLIVFIKRPGGQSQFSAALNLQKRTGRFDHLHAWILQNLHRRLSLSELASQASMSIRNFSRTYREATGTTPTKALEDIRLETARRLLEQGQMVSRVSRHCGFGSEETMRRAFLRNLGVAPQDYRDRFSR